LGPALASPRFMSDSFRKIRIGSRGSPLALIQARLFSETLRKKFADIETEIIPIRASGDEKPGEKDTPLYSIGGKGLFIKELEVALHAGQVDVAVHSMKDVPGILDDEFAIACALPREDPRDVFISPHAVSPEGLPEDSVVGTTSPRRRAQVLRHWPHLKVVPLRGNVETRLRKLNEGQVHGTFLAYAGLKRLGREKETQNVMDVGRMLPCAGQGIIGVEILKANTALASMLAIISHGESYAAMQAERAMLAVLNGSCDTAIGALAEVKNGEVTLEGVLLEPEGKDVWSAKGRASVSEAAALGEKIGREIRAKAPKGILPD
jgi:hydroxymethylbilane synthase